MTYTNALGKVDTGYLRDNPGSTRDSNDEGCPSELGVRERLGQLRLQT